MSLRGSVVHIKKFADGRMTPEEMHCQVVFAGEKCGGCGALPRIRVSIFMPQDEVLKRHPQIAALALHDPAKLRKMTVRNAHGTYFKVSESFACKSCQPALERAAAKAPSYAMVDIFRPPPDIKIISSG